MKFGPLERTLEGYRTTALNLNDHKLAPQRSIIQNILAFAAYTRQSNARVHAYSSQKPLPGQFDLSCRLASLESTLGDADSAPFP